MLAAGSQAPAFSLRCGPYRETTLDDYRGKRLVVVFYVADWHPVCTGQLLRYREIVERLYPGYQRILLFLGPDGSPASDAEEANRWIPLDYAVDSTALGSPASLATWMP